MLKTLFCTVHVQHCTIMCNIAQCCTISWGWLRNIEDNSPIFIGKYFRHQPSSSTGNKNPNMRKEQNNFHFHAPIPQKWQFPPPTSIAKSWRWGSHSIFEINLLLDKEVVGRLFYVCTWKGRLYSIILFYIFEINLLVVYKLVLF